MKLASIILAAGKGKRMKSEIPKVLHPVCGFPMLKYPVDLATGIGSEKIIVVIGHKSEEIKERFKDMEVTFVIQKEQIGTGDAVLSTYDELKEFDGIILILPGDAPLLKSNTILSMIEHHERCNADITILSSSFDNPEGYGRIIRENNRVSEIIEDKDLGEEYKNIKEVNSGVYCINSNILFNYLRMINNDNSQGEYYLTDIVRLAVKNGDFVSTFKTDNSYEILGINNRIDLAIVNEIMRDEINNSLMINGVTIIDPKNTYIERMVKIERDSIVYPNSYIRGNTIIGERCIIESGSWIYNSIIGNDAVIKAFSVITDSVIGNNVSIGPFSHLRPETRIEDNVKIGNFVEVKKSIIKKGSKASHLSYLGDATVGEDVNIGAGTITCNYDGFKKHPTIIGDRAFVGSDTQFVAPVKVGEDSVIGAGSVITKDVPKGALAIARGRQTNIDNWKKRKK
jgi:bifunctional UDP-N-acetylglucosamine pyrophosphorylase/glucosamine-1-phosphate N-acetyltransferase